MRLQTRILLRFILVGLTILLLTGALTYPNLEEQERDSIKKESITQLEHIDFALTYMIDEAGRDV